MGQLKSDGKAVDTSAPAATPMDFGELYRVDGWNGIALKTVGASDTVRGLSLEVSSERVWYVLAPDLSLAKGDFIYWGTAGTGNFHDGPTDISDAAGKATASDSPCGVVEEDQDANFYVAIRVLNVGPMT